MKNNKKFTLIELLVVVAIIGILAAMILPALGTARDKAQQKKCTNNLKQTGLSMAMYFSDGAETVLPSSSATVLTVGDDMVTLLEINTSMLSCSAKRATKDGYGNPAAVSGDALSSFENATSLMFFDAIDDGSGENHTTGGKANAVYGDGHVSPLKF